MDYQDAINRLRRRVDILFVESQRGEYETIGGATRTKTKKRRQLDAAVLLEACTALHFFTSAFTPHAELFAARERWESSREENLGES